MIQSIFGIKLEIYVTPLQGTPFHDTARRFSRLVICSLCRAIYRCIGLLKSLLQRDNTNTIVQLII